MTKILNKDLFKTWQFLESLLELAQLKSEKANAMKKINDEYAAKQSAFNEKIKLQLNTQIGKDEDEITTIQAKIDELENNLDKDKKVVEADGYL